MVEILVVEDNDLKFEDFNAILRERLSMPIEITRAPTVLEAENLLDTKPWSLLILDISMNISPGSLGPMRGGHANLGGLDIVEHMFLMEIEIPTIIVTGFDYFNAMRPGQDQPEMLSLQDIEFKARSKIKGNLVSCIRYGKPEWRAEFISSIAQAGCT